jgi:hypothetical protein
MARKSLWLTGFLLAALANTGCCRWCERWCGHGHAPAYAPTAYAPAPTHCVPCCPVPVCCPSSPAPAAGPAAPPGQWQRQPFGP